MKLSDNLKKIRKENNLSQEQLAEKLGVSRQAVSKWESDQSFPEMDKILSICEIFGYNIDELMNENIAEVNETKQSKININKYIDDFFAFITKTADLISCLTFKQKLKCIVEQIFIAFIFILIFGAINIVVDFALHKLFGFLPYEVFNIINDIIGAIYIFLSLVVGIAVLLHLFKIRYLDYFEIVKKDSETASQENEHCDNAIEQDEPRKLFLEKSETKIIIREPQHSQSKFLSGIIRIVLWFVKLSVVFFSFFFIVSFIALTAMLVLSFLFAKTGLMFVGTLLGLVSAIVINAIILILSYDFIVNKKPKKNKMAIASIISIIGIGLSVGIVLISVTGFDFTDKISQSDITQDVYAVEMMPNLSINSNCKMSFVPSNIENIEIYVQRSVYQKSDFINGSTQEYAFYDVFVHDDMTKNMDKIRKIIKDVNSKILNDYDYAAQVTVYASEENIEKLTENLKIRYK